MRPLVRAGTVAGSADLAEAQRWFAELREGQGPRLIFGTCAPTAAFSRRDTHLSGYAAAEAVVREHGFEPVIRPVGGRLAAYDEGSLVVHLTAPQREAHQWVNNRFELFAAGTAAALTSLGVPDVRIGSVPGEYCEGEWSVNTGGVAKLAGTGQRVNRHGFLFSAVITVAAPQRLRGVLADAYATLGLPFDPLSVGSVDTWTPDVTMDDVISAMVAHLDSWLPAATA